MSVDLLKHYGTQINESILGTFAKLLVAPKIRKTFNRLAAQSKEDPEIIALLADLRSQIQRVNDATDNYCELRPNSPLCKKKEKK
jgi:hypothetical protein